MPSAESTAWWDDVQHLKPQAAAPIELVRDEPARDEAAARPRRVAAATAEPCLSREHAADFADAFDIDGAFGAPRRRFGRAAEDDATGGRVIVLERSPAREDADAYAGDRHADDRRRADDRDADDRHAARGAVEVDDWHDAEAEELLGDEVAGAPVEPAADERRLVRITGRPEAAIAPRRLRDVEPRRRRTSAVDRAASRPDRIALYAVLLGLFLVVLAAASSSAHP